ncbi:Asp23/Gls24 family envelope stress response protein [Pseudonocardia sp. RS11V-5]|uniref:Asp23/Gls24 family envelope stress response protein n=1 Tax=Pseudonocardia terrae TaxID=2905831 RepID=UPI001E297A4B|nr:Asp23/Gls24 family envelope stress response protein [Pseudonocardia terrae]MCE3552293.1 Asp23/Gls24 family envelope stress response protein [Pseudonocardia terrae]
MTPPVRLTVGDAVVARIAAATAREVPGVVALRPDLAQTLLGLAGSLLGDRPAGDALSAAGASAAVQQGRAEVALTLVTTLGHNTRDLSATVQRAVAARVRAETGLDAVVSVTIADVLLDAPQAERESTQSPQVPPPGSR